MIFDVFQVSVKLRVYEEAVQEAAEAGLLVSFVTDITDQGDCPKSELPPIVTERWSILQAVFFASTVLTTIGIRFLIINKESIIKEFVANIGDKNRYLFLKEKK